MSEEVKQEEIQKVDPKQVERELLEEMKRRSEDPIEQAGMVYTTYLPEFLKRVRQLSARGRARVLESLVQYPLAQKQVSLPNQLEKEVFYFADSMLQAKFIMMQATYLEAQQELMAAAETTTEYENKEVTNG